MTTGASDGDKLLPSSILGVSGISSVPVGADFSFFELAANEGSARELVDRSVKETARIRARRCAEDINLPYSGKRFGLAYRTNKEPAVNLAKATRTKYLLRHRGCGILKVIKCELYSCQAEVFVHIAPHPNRLHLN